MLVQALIERRAVSRHASLDLSACPQATGSALLSDAQVPALPGSSPLVTVNEKFSFQDAVAIANVCKSWISDLFKLGLQEAFRIELCHIGDLWQLRLCIHPVAWFDLIREQNGEADALIHARAYLELCEREHIPATVLICEQASSGKCEFDDAGCDAKECIFRHVLWRCRHSIPLRTYNTKLVECGFPVFVEDLMADGENWTLHRRYQEGTRELLLMPKAKFVEKDGFPHGNVAMVQTPLFWHVALAESRQLDALIGDQSAVERIVINFGQWEAAERRDPYASECHAHAHVWLSKKFISDVSQEPFSEALAACHANPQDYLRENARALRERRINDLRIAAVEIMQTELKTEMCVLKTEMGAMKTEMGAMKIPLGALATMVQQLVDRFPPSVRNPPISSNTRVDTLRCCVCGKVQAKASFSKNQRSKKEPKCQDCVGKAGL